MSQSDDRPAHDGAQGNRASEIVDRRGEFPKFVDHPSPPPAFADFVAAVRELMDLAVSTDAPNEVYADGTRRAGELAARLAPYREAVEAEGPAGRCAGVPGRGSVMESPWRLEQLDADGMRTTITFSRFHVGGHAAVHGGIISHTFDQHLGWILLGAGLPIARTAYLHVDFRRVVPVGVPVTLEGAVDRVEGRKMYVGARLRAADGTVLAECEALMVALLPGQA